MTDPRQRFEELLDLHLDNALSAGERAEFDALLAGHPAWADEVRQEEQLAALLTGARSVKAPPDLLERAFDRGVVEDAVEDDKARWRGISQIAVLAAGLMIFGSIYYFAGRDDAGPVIVTDSAEEAPALAMTMMEEDAPARAAERTPEEVGRAEAVPAPAPGEAGQLMMSRAPDQAGTFALDFADGPPVVALAFSRFEEIDEGLAARSLELLALTPDWETAAAWPPMADFDAPPQAGYYGRVSRPDGEEAVLLLQGPPVHARARAAAPPADDGERVPGLDELLAGLEATTTRAADGGVDVRLADRAAALDALLRVSRWSGADDTLDPRRALLRPDGDVWLLSIPIPD